VKKQRCKYVLEARDVRIHEKSLICKYRKKVRWKYRCEAIGVSTGERPEV
jgi:hypothetical protein